MSKTVKETTVKKAVEDYILYGIHTCTMATIIRYINEARRRYPDWYQGVISQRDELVNGENSLTEAIGRTLDDPSKMESKVIDYAEDANKVDAVIVSPHKDLNDEDLITLAGLNPNMYQVTKFSRGGWTTPMKIKKNGVDEKGESYSYDEVTVVQNWKYTIQFTLRTVISPEELTKVYTDVIKEFKPNKNFHIISHKTGAFMVEPAIADVHIGRLAHGEETHGENYDTNIAVQRYFSVNATFLESYKNTEVEQVLLPRGNDFLNSNSMLNTTLRGTPQDEDSRWYKVWRKAFEIEVQTVEMWRQLAPVRYVAILSNHDWERFFYLAEAVQAYFKDYDDVTFDNEPVSQKSFRFGANFLNFSHKLKEKNADSLILHDNKDNLSGVKFIEYQTAHFHNEKTVATVGGTTIRWLPSLAELSKWESDNEYRARPQAQSFLYHKEDGLVDIKQIHRFAKGERSK